MARKSNVTRAQRQRETPDVTPLSEDAIADSFARKQEGYLRYDGNSRCWMRWNGRYWHGNSDLEVLNDVRITCRAAAREAPASLAVRLSSGRTVTNVERLARSDPRLLVQTLDWDGNDFLFNTPEGTIDLRNGKLLAHDPMQGITRMGPVAPAGDCPAWRRFIAEVACGDEELQRYLQRMAGYCLTGSTREQVLFFLLGSGANGKSVFVRVLSELLGPYATTAAMETFMAAGSGRHPTDLASLKGARLVIASETERSRKWAEGRIKVLTGGDDVAARLMYQDFSTHRPRYKLMITGNIAPQLSAVDEAMRRRIRILPFSLAVPEHARDPFLIDKLRDELPGILQWAIDGCNVWQSDGLAPPPTVALATSSYFDGEDLLGRFLFQRCDCRADLRASSSDLYNAFNRWAQLNGEAIDSHHTFVRNLRYRGFATGRNASHRYVNGLALKTRTHEVKTEA